MTDPKRNKRQIEWRHRVGISKSYKISKFDNSIQRRKIMKRLHRKNYKLRLTSAGKLTFEIIQTVYEENIKKYGTLTCYLCLIAIRFGTDNLEHKTPISRGGINSIDNLEISCRDCNYRKHDKTLEEYTKELKK